MFYRMAVKPLLRQLLIWTSISTAYAHSIELPSQVSAFIPDCAQTCVEVFIGLNFLSTACGTSPSLQCLCSHQSQSGFTIGEGAVQCIVGSDHAGACKAGEVDPSVVGAAYDMCSGQTSALPNTHPTLSATLIIPSSGVGIIIIETPTPTTSASRRTSTRSITSTPTTLLTSPPGFSTPPPTITTTTSSTFSSSTTTTSSRTETAADSRSTPTSSPTPASATLGTNQIVGISLGISGAVAVALVAICLARRARKRNFPNVDDGFYPMDDKSHVGAPSEDGWVGGGFKKRITTIFHISPPILKYQQQREQQQEYQQPLPPREYTPTPPLPSAGAIDRSTIGLAISRPRSDMISKKQAAFPPPVESPRRSSKMLPPKPLKPALTLNIPASSTLRPPSSQPPQTDRTSTMTNMTAFADLDTEAQEGAQIWRPPPSDPQSATAYYVADKWGNWVLNNENRQSRLMKVAEVAELDTYTPLTKSPIEKQEEEAVAMAAAISAASPRPDVTVTKPQPAFLASDPAGSSGQRSSSVYSQVSSAPRPAVRPYGPGANKSNSFGRKKTERSNSVGSATTINTSSSEAWDNDEDSNIMDDESRHQSVLSPVMESPRSPVGRSPVTYPKIPGRFNGATIRLVPPPKRPNFTASPPGQPSPTLGAVMPVRGSPPAYPAPLNPRRYSTINRQPAQAPPFPQTSGSGFSPEKKSMPTFPSPPQRNPQRAFVENGYNDNMQISPTRMPRGGGGSSSNNRQNPPRIDTNVPPPSPSSRQRPHISSFISPASTSSATTSLLAKRVGADRAAALSLENGAAAGKKKGASWRRQDLLSPDAAGGMISPRHLPATPLWHPKLTPTRRGDDLFLNVQ